MSRRAWRRGDRAWTAHASASFLTPVRIERVVRYAGRPHYVVVLRDEPDAILGIREAGALYPSEDALACKKKS